MFNMKLEDCETNADYIMFAKCACAYLVQLEEQYKKATTELVDGSKMNIPAAKITAMKQEFAALRNDIKTALDSVTG